jgi:hypothetical protein
MGKDTLSAIHFPFDAKDCHIKAFVSRAKFSVFEPDWPAASWPDRPA